MFSSFRTIVGNVFGCAPKRARSLWWGQKKLKAFSPSDLRFLEVICCYCLTGGSRGYDGELVKGASHRVRPLDAGNGRQVRGGGQSQAALHQPPKSEIPTHLCRQNR